MREIRLEEITTVSSGQGAPQGDSSYSFDEGIPFIKAGDMDFLTNGGSIQDIQKVERDVAEENKLTEYPKGSIVFAKSGMSAKKDRVYCLDADSYVVNHLAIIEPNNKEYLSRFLTYYLQFYKPSKLIRDEAYPSIRISDIRKLEIPLPSLYEQKAIVAKLDRAQRLIDIDREMLAKYDDLIQSVFLEMFGDPVRNEKGWEVKKLGDLTTKVGSGSTPRGGSKVYQDHGNIFIRSQNVLMNKLNLEDVAYISDEIHEGMKNTWVEENDVLLNITGASIGRVCVYNQSGSANVNQHVCILRPIQENIKPYYLSHLISSRNYQDKILGQQTGGTRQAFNMTQIKNFDIPLPPIEEQIRFHDLLTKLKHEIKKMKFDLKKSEELFSSLVQGVFG